VLERRKHSPTGDTADLPTFRSLVANQLEPTRLAVGFL